MSGPKCLDLNVSTVEAARMGNARTCEGLLAQIQALYATHEDELKQIQEMGGSHPMDDAALEKLKGEIAKDLEECDGSTAVQACVEHLKWSEMAVAGLAKQIEKLLQSWLIRARKIEEARTQLLKKADAFEGQAWVRHLRELKPISFGSDGGTLAEIEARESLLEDLVATYARAEKESFSFSSLATSGTLPQALMTTQDFLKQNPAVSYTPEDIPSEKFHEWEGRLLSLDPSEESTALLERLRGLSAIKDKVMRQFEYENIQLNVQEMMKDQQIWRKREDLLAGYSARLEAMTIPKAREVMEEVLRLQQSDEDLDPKEWDLVFRELQKLQQEEDEREFKRLAVLEAFSELGYEVEFHSASPANLHATPMSFRRPGREPYEVSVVTNGSFQLMQTELIRKGDASEKATSDQKLRDREEEMRWCSDHAKLVHQLEQAGIKAAFKLKKSPGEVPIRVVNDAEIAAAQKNIKKAKPSENIKPGP